jgi:hypothetical protein
MFPANFPIWWPFSLCAMQSLLLSPNKPKFESFFTKVVLLVVLLREPLFNELYVVGGRLNACSVILFVGAFAKL